MSRRCLELLRYARALDSERPSAEVRRRLADALVAASESGTIDDHLVSYTPDDLAMRDWQLSRACDHLSGETWRQRLIKLTDRARRFEADVIEARIDIDRPASWPPLQSWEEHLLHALAHGPMISRTRFYEQIVSGQGGDRKPCEPNININKAMSKWPRPQTAK